MPHRRSLALAGLSLLAVLPAAAHHGWGEFDRDQTLDVTGNVVRSTFANPHGLVVLSHQGQELSFELAPVSRMSQRGLTAADIAQGRTVRLYGYRNTRTPTLYRAEWIEVSGRRIELR